MEKQYLCPKCSGHLKIDDYIVLVVTNQEKYRGLILLHPEVGNYTSIKHPSFRISKNEVLELCCPLCHTCLASDFDNRLVHLILEEDAKSFDIYFSRIAGEESTYLVDGNSVTATGEHSDRYTYFKMGDKFKQYLHKNY